MQYYVMSRNDQIVGILFTDFATENFSDISYHRFDGPIPDLNYNEWDAVTETFRPSRSNRIMSRLEFLERFTQPERLAIAASTDPVVLDIMRMFNIVDHVQLDNPTTVAALRYFVRSGFITQARYTEILG